MKATQLLFKANLAKITGANHDGDGLWQVTAVPVREMLHAVDRAMLVRLIAGLRETRREMEKEHVAPLLVGKHSEVELHKSFEVASSLADGSAESQA